MKKLFFTLLFVLLPFAFSFADQKDGDEDIDSLSVGNNVSADLSLFAPPSDVAFNPTIGSWAKYTLEDKIKKTSYELTIAVVGEEKVQQGMANWIEISTLSSKGTPIVTKYLWIPSSENSEVLRMMVKAGNYPPVEVDTHKKIDEQNRHIKGEFQKIGEEKVMVNGQKIFTTSFRHKLSNGETVRLWVSSKIPPFGIIRSISLSHELVLLEYGNGYKSKIKKPSIKIDEKQEKSN